MSKCIYARDHTENNCWFEISIDGQKLPGRLEFEVYSIKTPKTLANFEALLSGKNEKGLSYKGTKFVKIYRGYMCQGGDVVNDDGTGYTSIYGEVFEDESYHHYFDRRGTLAMVNAGPNTNGCQFFITFDKAPWANHRYVAFGRMHNKIGEDILKRIEQCGSEDGTPTREVRIYDCGQKRAPSPNQPEWYSSSDASTDYDDEPEGPWDWDSYTMPKSPEEIAKEQEEQTSQEKK